MPTLSTFYGVVIRMYYDDHAPPHMHAIYGGDEALIDIESLDLLQGNLPKRAFALVKEWAKIHQDELRTAWQKAEAHEPLGTIPPLD